MKCWMNAVIALGAMLIATTAMAVPATVTYTGELTAENGLAYNGNVMVSVKAFDAMMDGNMLADEDLGEVFVSGGLLELNLEEIGAAAQSTSTLWLEVTVDGETLTPRQRVTTVAYAHRAGDADTLGGMPASAFMINDGGSIDEESLPTNGLGVVSNGALSNEFENVQFDWPSDPQDIGDFPAPATLATVTTSETGSSYLTSLQIETIYSLVATSRIVMTLIPPVGTGIGAITLIDDSEEIDSGTYANLWTPANTPELAPLIGTEVQGEWFVSIQDTTEDLIGTTKVGSLDSFKILYDVVRSDEIAVFGDQTVTGDLNVQGTINGGGVERSGTTFTYYGSENCPGSSEMVYAGFTMTNDYNHSGSSEAICVKPGNPGNTTSSTASQGYDLLYPTRVSNSSQYTGNPDANIAMRCAVCFVPEKGPCFDMWGDDTCPENWQTMYDGFGHGSHYQHNASYKRICLDPNDYDTSAGGSHNGIYYPMSVWQTGGTGMPTQRTVKCAKCCRQ